MKKIIILLLVVSTILTTNIMAQNEFSSSLIGVGVVCSDLEESLDFYLNVIGMKKTGEFDVNADFAKISGLSNGVPFHVDVLQLGEDGNVWKLMSFGKEATQPKSKFIQDDMGVQYITINVTSMKPFLERIKKHKVKLLGETPVPLGNDGRQFVLIQAPEGTIVELIGPGE
ncbi:MAG: VOC family protein [Bacteroidetes bacterium]|nr:VOC family protein [Bacteroidota bacterium]